jgi:hypothetical protein
MNEPDPTSTVPRTDRRLLAVAAALSVALAVAVAWVDYLPTNDGPQHIFSAYLQDHLDDAGRGWNRYLARGALITGSGFDRLLTVLNRLLTWRSAFRVALTGLALVWAWSVMALGASLGTRRRWLGLLGFATALQWLFYMGLFSCYLSTALGFLVLAMAFHFGYQRRPKLVWMAALLATQTIVHVVPAALTGLTLLIHAWLSSKRDDRPRMLMRIILVGTPAILIAAVALGLAGGGEQLNHYRLFLPFTRQVMLLGRAFVSGPPWRAWPVTVLALASGVVVIARWRATPDARERTLVLAGLGQLVLALATHLHIVGWEYFNVRFIPNAIVFLSLLAPVEWFKRPALARMGAASLAVFSLASIMGRTPPVRCSMRRESDANRVDGDPLLQRSGIAAPPPAQTGRRRGQPARAWGRGRSHPGRRRQPRQVASPHARGDAHQAAPQDHPSGPQFWPDRGHGRRVRCRPPRGGGPPRRRFAKRSSRRHHVARQAGPRLRRGVGLAAPAQGRAGHAQDPVVDRQRHHLGGVGRALARLRVHAQGLPPLRPARCSPLR